MIYCRRHCFLPSFAVHDVLEAPNKSKVRIGKNDDVAVDLGVVGDVAHTCRRRHQCGSHRARPWWCTIFSAHRNKLIQRVGTKSRSGIVMIRLLVLVPLRLVFVLLFSNVNSIKGRCEEVFLRVGNVAVDLGVVTLPPPSCDFSSDEASEDENDSDRANMPPPPPSVVMMLVGEYNFGARLVLCRIMV